MNLARAQYNYDAMLPADDSLRENAIELRAEEIERERRGDADYIEYAVGSTFCLTEEATDEQRATRLRLCALLDTGADNCELGRLLHLTVDAERYAQCYADAKREFES